MIKDDGLYEYWRFDATVLETSAWTETHVSGGGGGGMYGVSNYAPITTTVTQRNRVWVRHTDGSEQEINDVPVGCRPGNRLHIIGAKSKWDKDDIYSYYGFYNATTGENGMSRCFRDMCARKTLDWNATGGFYMTIIWLGLVILMYSTARSNDPVFGPAVVTAGLAWVIAKIITAIRLSPRESRLNKAYKAFLDEVHTLPCHPQEPEETVTITPGRLAAAS